MRPLAHIVHTHDTCYYIKRVYTCADDDDDHDSTTGTDHIVMISLLVRHAHVHNTIAARGARCTTMRVENRIAEQSPARA